VEILPNSEKFMMNLATGICQYCGAALCLISSCYQNNAPDEVMRAIANQMLKYGTNEWSTYCANFFNRTHTYQDPKFESVLVYAVCYDFPANVTDKLFSFYRSRRGEHNKDREDIMYDILEREIRKSGDNRILKDILLSYPECARRNPNLLQQAIQLRHSGVISALVAANPEAAQNISDFQSHNDSVDLVRATPLAMTIAMKMSQEAVLSVFKAYQFAATVHITSKDKTGLLFYYYPFFLAITNGYSEVTVNVLFQEVLLNAKFLREKEPSKSPLIYSLSIKLSDVYLLKIIEADNESAKLEYGKPKELVLHHALQARMSDAVILAILLAYKDAAKVKDAEDLFPLHYALENKFSGQVVLELFNCNKRAATFPTPKSNKMPYKIALIKGYPRVSLVEQLIKPVIELTEKLRSNHQVIVFHDLLMYQIPENFVLKTLEVDPDSAGIAIPQGFLAVDQQGNSQKIDETKLWVQDVLPLNLAITKRYPEELIIKIYEKYPSAAYLHVILHDNKNEPSKKSIKVYPFWLAQTYGYSDILVSILFDRLKVESKSIRETSQGSISPVHDLIVAKVEDNYLLEILQADSLAVEMAYSGNGDLPLHRALKKEFSEAVLLKLIDLYEQASAIRNSSEQRLPIHEAAMRGTSPVVIERLISVYPESLKMKDKNGYFPADLVQSKLPKESIALICRLKKEPISTNRPQDSLTLSDASLYSQIEISNRILDLERLFMKFFGEDNRQSEGLANLETIKGEILDDANKHLLDCNTRIAATKKV